jgi:hypothetical protein
MTDIFDRYFTLSDAAVSDSASFAEFARLFAPDAVIYSSNQAIYLGVNPISGFVVIKKFFRDLLSRSTILRHAWTAPRIKPNGEVIVDWAVAGVRKTGEVFCSKGTDSVELDESGRIKRLDIG